VSDAGRLKDLPFEHCLLIDGQWYVFGEATYTYAPKTADDMIVTNRYLSPWYKRLFTYALHRCYGLIVQQEGISERIEPEIVLSIPAELFKNQAIADKVKANLVGTYYIETTLGTTYSIHVLPEHLTIIPEGVGSFLSACAEFPAAQAGTWVVVDPGYLTTDLVVFRDMEYIPDLATSDAAAGMNTVSSRIAAHIFSAYDIHLKTSLIDENIECESIVIQNAAVPIQQAKIDALTKLAKRINTMIQLATADLLIDGLILTGGGAKLLQEFVKGPGAIIPLKLTDHRRGNVEGGFLMLKGEAG
jgi:hypothetical protein